MAGLEVGQRVRIAWPTPYRKMDDPLVRPLGETGVSHSIDGNYAYVPASACVSASEHVDDMGRRVITIVKCQIHNVQSVSADAEFGGE